MGRTARSLEIARVLSSRRMLHVARELGLFRPAQPTEEGAECLRDALERLGTTFVKLGQLLASRPDLVGELYAERLAGLQDDLTPIAARDVIGIVERSLDRPLAAVFSWFDEQPLASASIAQTHAAVLAATGASVVVKVRRPGIDGIIEQDLEILANLARRAESRVNGAQLLQVRTIVDELSYSLRRELDMRADASNTRLIGSLLEDYETILVPTVYDEFVTEDVFVMERLDGVRVDEPSFGAELDRERASTLARDLLRAFIRQILVHGVYHADPHPGNVLCRPREGALVLLDFGLVGKLDDSSRVEFTLLLLAMAENRAADMADLMLRMSRTTRESDRRVFERELRRLLPRYRGAALGDIDVGQALVEVQTLALRCGVALPIPFALIGKTLSQVDTIARALDPDVNPLELLRADALRVGLEQAREASSPAAMLSLVGAPALSLLQLPRRAEHVLEQLQHGELEVGITPHLEDAVGELRTITNRLAAAIVTAAVVVASALLMNVRGVGTIGGYPALGLIGFLVACAFASVLVVRMVRTEGGL